MFRLRVRLRIAGLHRHYGPDVLYILVIVGLRTGGLTLPSPLGQDFRSEWHVAVIVDVPMNRCRFFFNVFIVVCTLPLSPLPWLREPVLCGGFKFFFFFLADVWAGYHFLGGVRGEGVSGEERGSRVGVRV